MTNRTNAQHPGLPRGRGRAASPAPEHPTPVVVRPGWGPGADGRDPLQEDKAARADREHRAAWGGRLPSAYSHAVALPDHIAPGDTATAHALLTRIEGCLELTGRFTPLERRRLRGMRDAWARRASGDDPLFNVAGWTRRPAFTKRGAWEQAARDRKFAAILTDLRTTTSGE